MDSNTLATLYKTVIEEELGMIAKIDDTDDVIFKYPDLGTLYFSLDAENDPEYLMLVFPNFADAKSLELSREQLLLAINNINSSSKAVKLSIRRKTIDTDCDVTATVEAFVGAPNQAPAEAVLRQTIKRNLSALRAGARNLIEESKKIKGDQVETM
ncbi:hypothetical protein [Janthinobacterium aquaticum]|uniref:hypothetical protein n=1 Tax=Janthinobacterium sp. FT58W TaxID=2654254 RepID=UPI0012650A5A|nr:hypothetical protein [Janthinobacterium sp. FT58W]KAB8045170.1 hypothetical protein GCM43_01740 [Janthinobacterium sp. FT58W]